MNEFLRNHPDVILVGLATIFVVILAAFYFWGIDALSHSINQALNPIHGPSQPIVFKLQDAEGLLKGTVTQ